MHCSGSPANGRRDTVDYVRMYQAFGLLPMTVGTGHVCQNADGSLTNCLSSPRPVVGPSCSPVYTQLAPDFWN
jgi:hypothetical protein